MKTVYLLSYNDWWSKRINLYAQWFVEHGFDVKYITSDFNHFTKKPIDKSTMLACAEYIHVPEYRRNLSIRRVLSHWIYSLKVLRLLMDKKPDIVLGVLPCNSLGLMLWFYKKTHSSVRLIVDVTDMWPESLPISKFSKKLLSPFVWFWRWLRDMGVSAADKVICECNLFAQMVARVKLKENPSVVYLNSEEKAEYHDVSISGGVLKVAYLGSINHIIDINGIVNLLQKMKMRRPVELHIIGGGISCEYFIKSVEAVGVPVIWHGMIFDAKKRREILSGCHYGLNMMKSSVFVGLTTKSIDYTSSGLPLLNTIRGDSFDLVNRYNMGFNVTMPRINLDEIVFMRNADYQKMRKNAVLAFDENFYNVAVKAKINKIMSDAIEQ